MYTIRRPHQSGMVSILVTMIIMLVISLIVLGFAQISRREQRQTLDRQLSAQAFFAAESGINDARKVINAKLAAGEEVPEKEVCEPDGTYKADPLISTPDNVSYSCLLVSTKVQNLTGNLTANGKSVTLPLEAEGDARTVHVNWRDPTGNLTEPMLNAVCDTALPPDRHFDRDTNGGWKCPYGVLRMDIVPTSSFDRAATMDGQRTFFLYPTHGAGSGTVPYGGPTGTVASMKCTATGGCNIDITGMFEGPDYAVRLTSIYVDGTFDITAKDGAGAPLILRNGQVLVDATGRAQDVLRRIQVRLPMVTTSMAPTSAIESGSSICKRFEITGNSFLIPSNFKKQDDKNPMCRPISIAPPKPPDVTVVPCAKRGPTHVRNGDFALGAGMAPLVNESLYGFTTKLPNRGPDVFPDDNGTSGATPDLRGWTGGLSVQTFGPKLMNGNFVFYRPFPGDDKVNPAVPAVQTALFTNPNQSIDEPKGTYRTNTFVGALWEATITDLKPDTRYDFSGYFVNVLTSYFLDPRPNAVNARIEFSIDGKTIRPIEEILPSNSTWKRITLTFRTGSGQTSAYFTIKDYAGYVLGDDFAMTQLGVYECLE